MFSRNIKTIFQTQQLTKSIKTIFNDNNYPILIDEEGGKVSRLRNFIDNSIFTHDFLVNCTQIIIKNLKFILIYM